MARSQRRILFSALILLPGSIALGVRHWPTETPNTTPDFPTPVALQSAGGMNRLPAGSFVMGSLHAEDYDAQPLHRVELPSFWLDIAPVTNRQFQRFVEQIGYETEAETKGSSLVFDRQLAAWHEIAGASWRHPEGPNSSLVGRETHPVVHVTWQDAATYSAWVGKRLPTEAEMEYAARGGLSDCLFPWGRKLIPGDQHMANGWQGHFPQEDLGLDRFRGTSPVGQFSPNRFGLHDMAGNVWNWCADWYAVDYYGSSLTQEPRGPRTGTERVRRGGSWLSAVNYDGGLRLACRDHAPPGESTNHTGFRCARDNNAD